MDDKELIAYLLGELEKIKNMTMPKSLDDLTNKYYEIKEIAILAIHKSKTLKTN